VFDKETYSLVPYGYVALNRQQRKKHRIKKRHCYQVQPYIPNPLPLSIATIFDREFKYRERVGGLDSVFETIFSDVLLSRFYPRSFVDLTDLTKPRGFILYGPPGTGKTLIAKTLANILNTPAKIVSGPELLNWLLGESEAKVRALFEEAHSDQEKYGSQSPLHLIIFDEIDAICQRRSTESSSARNSVHNSINTQILTEIDGIRYLDNILIVGTINVLEAIDPALFRPGRLDTLIKVPLPNAEGRSAIFNIYTKTLLKNSLISDDVNIERLTRQTRGMTGAHIEQLVRRAVHSAMKRDLQSRGTLQISDEDAEKLQVKNIDFTVAITQLQTQVENRTAF
jgi:vesicle-fusing ATPase